MTSATTIAPMNAFDRRNSAHTHLVELVQNRLNLLGMHFRPANIDDAATTSHEVATILASLDHISSIDEVLPVDQCLPLRA